MKVSIFSKSKNFKNMMRVKIIETYIHIPPPYQSEYYNNYLIPIVDKSNDIFKNLL